MSERDLSFLAERWQILLGEEFSSPYMAKVREFLRAELRARNVFYPPKEQIFRALKLVDYHQVKVVVLGQDPYHGAGQANGLAFAVSQGVPPPPSLVNIFKAIELDLGAKYEYKHATHLEDIAQQGVLFLNTVLTVRASTAFSHRDKGWEVFTDKIIQLLNNKSTPVVFLLWGAAAQSKAKMLTNPIHKILTAPHPSPLSAHRGFLQCRHFSKTNEFLVANNLSPVDWTV